MNKQVNLELRPIAEEDTLFLHQVYASTREEELRLLDWTTAEKERFLEMQFNAQHQYYQAQFPKADFLLVLRHQEKVGRFYVDEREDEVRIVDIALLPSFQKQGIGTHLLKGTLSKAQRTGKSVGIHVERFNPALKWYVQLGFRQVSDQGVYLFLKWQPQGE